ncbi:hypothetical protein HYPDE_37463 [Hyphomicrobium denitrificans 1NES1]|uniref:Uncharacterized protein n=1 Tax=Hyphomicrobium denitrificans 1NES1 TaxID=670307 RepID=N0B6F3_9HYPH|nr:hypothetical protein HYPDE_37463 [Hyphomicrobium denitrificans 1NES1]
MEQSLKSGVGGATTETWNLRKSSMKLIYGIESGRPTVTTCNSEDGRHHADGHKERFNRLVSKAAKPKK